MDIFGNLYSQYYDLLYKDKNYNAERDYINKLIKQNNKNAKSILDMGCGTGKHASLLCDIGYKVHGIDQSEDMLEIAKTRINNDRLSFTHSDIASLKLNEEFDVVTSLFHVMSYQTTNACLESALQTAKYHLKNNGIFIFDFWYGPAVLTDLPTTRIKRLENETIKVTRFAEPTIHAMKNVVDVAYDIFIEDKINQQIIEKTELHKMRYFFDIELEMICKNIGFKIEKRYKWMSIEKPNFNSWNVVWIVRK